MSENPVLNDFSIFGRLSKKLHFLAKSGKIAHESLMILGNAHTNLHHKISKNLILKTKLSLEARFVAEKP